MWAEVAQTRKNFEFWYKFTLKGYTPLSNFYKICCWMEVPGPHPHAKFTIVVLKMWAYGLKIAKHDNFWYKFSPKWYIFFHDFYKIVPGEEVSGLHSHAKFHHCSFKNVALRSQKSPKMVFFPLRKILGFHRKT